MPPAKAPYHMSQLELVELKNQLKEMIDAGHIQSCVATDGAPARIGTALPQYITKLRGTSKSIIRS